MSMDRDVFERLCHKVRHSSSGPRRANVADGTDARRLRNESKSAGYFMQIEFAHPAPCRMILRESSDTSTESDAKDRLSEFDENAAARINCGRQTSPGARWRAAYRRSM